MAIRPRATGKSGFTLIELMIVVAIISVICAIAIPSMLRNRAQANESSAIEHLRVIASAQVSFNAAQQRYGAFADLTDDSIGPGMAFLNESWVDGVQKSGYVFTMASSSASNFVCFADPEVLGVTGTRYFRVDGSGIVRFSTSGQPTAADQPIGGH